MSDRGIHFALRVPRDFAVVVEEMTSGLAERIFVGNCICDPEWAAREVFDGACPRHGLLTILGAPPVLIGYEDDEQQEGRR